MLMADDIRLRPAAGQEDVARLREYVAAAEGAEGLAALERHLARPRARPEFTRLAERGGEIVGYALVAHRRLRLGAATLESGVIERIYAGPAQRDADVLSALVVDCVGALYEQAIPLATLRGPAGLYARFGFAPYLLRSRVYLDTTGSAEAAALPPGGLRALEAGDLEELSALYEASYGAVPLAEARAAPDWRLLAERGETLACRDRSGRTVGYARIEPGADGALLVVEAAAADAGAARLLLAGVLARGAAVLLAPPGHVVAQAGLQLGGELRLAAAPRAPDEPVALAGVVSLPLALEALAPELERRLAGSRYAGWSGSLRLELDSGRATLMFSGGRLSGGDGTRPADVRLRRLTLDALAQLLLGYRAAADLRADGGLDCDDTELGLVDALFPVLGACEGAESP